MPEKNLYKKDRSIYTKMIHKENIDKLNKKREALSVKATLEEQIELEKDYLKKSVNFIEVVIENEFRKRVFMVMNNTRSKEENVFKEICRLNYFGNLWKDTNNRLKLAFDLCNSMSELKEASNRMCDIISNLACKDTRTYNMLPVWEINRQSMVLNLALQNYELILDDFLNKLGSKGMAKLGDITEKSYSKREELDAKLDKAVLKLDKNNILKSLEKGAYVDLKLESDSFEFEYKPCTVLNYVLIKGMDDLAMDILKYEADVNIKNIMEDNKVFLPVLYALEKQNIGLTISVLNAGAILNKNFIGKDIKDMFRKVLGISKGLSNFKKLNESVIKEAYINDLISIDEIKEVLNKDEEEILIKALEDNDDVLSSKLLSLGVRLRKDEEITRKIEIDFVKDDFEDFFESYRFFSIPYDTLEKETVVRMYIKGLIPADKLVSIYKKSKQYLMDKILKLGGEVSLFNFLKWLIEKNKFDRGMARALDEYIKKTNNEELVLGLYISGIISIDVVSRVLGKDIKYFFQNARNNGNDMLMGRLLDSAPSVCKDEREMKLILKLVKDCLKEDKEKFEKSFDELVNKVNEYEKLVIKGDSYILDRETMNDGKCISKISVDRYGK